MLYLKELRTRFSEAQILKRLARPADIGLVPGGGSVFDRAVIAILQGLFYHTGMLKSRNFCKLLGMRRLGARTGPHQTSDSAILVAECFCRIKWRW